MSYDLALRQKVIRELVRENEQAPTRAQILERMAELRKKHVNLENRGFSALEIEVPGFLDPSSATMEVTNQEATMDDLYALGGRIKSLSDTLENDYRSFLLRVDRLKGIALDIEGKLNELLLLHGLEDAFTASVRRDFVEDINTTSPVTPTTNMTATVEGGLCFASRSQIEKIDLSTATITFTPLSRATILSQGPSAPASSVLELDGQIFEYIVLTDKQRASVDLVVTITFQQLEDVGEVRVAATSMRRSGDESYSVFYSFDGVDYELVQPAVRTFDRDSLLIPVGINQVKSIRLVFNKTVSDAKTVSLTQWAYGWQFDAIEIFRPSFGANEDYVLEERIALIDKSDSFRPASISKVSLDVCTIEPPGTGISWFVSAEGQIWQPINPYRKNMNIVTLRRTLQDGLAQFDATKADAALLNPRNYSSANVIDPNTWICNTFFTSPTNGDAAGQLELLLDVPDSAVINSGWYLNASDNWSCSVYISSPEGKTLDLGPKPALLNGRSVSGPTYFRPGWSRFETPSANFTVIPPDAPNEDILRTIDPLYPYNHKYVIEGYGYPEGYEGGRLYTGVDSWCGRVLEYRDPDDFEEDTDELWTWSFEIFPGLGQLVLVKVDPGANTLLTRTNSFTWTGIPENEDPDTYPDTDYVYVRAILTTSSEGLTPIIDWYVLRGI